MEILQVDDGKRGGIKRDGMKERWKESDVEKKQNEKIK